MFKLACNKLGAETCDFAATGETADEAIEKMKAHANEAHPEAVKAMEAMSPEDRTKKVMDAMETV